MDITATCAEITVTFPGGSASFNKEITTTEIVVAQNPESEDRVYLNQNSANAPLTFWWNLNKAIEFGYNTLQELYDYFVAEIANQCGGGGNSSITISENGVAKGTTSNVDFVDGDNTTVDVVKDLITGKIDVKVNSDSTTASNGLNKVADNFKLGGRTTDALTLVIVGAPIDNPTGGTALVFTDTPNRPTVTVGTYSDDFSSLTTSEIINFNTTNTQIAQVGILDNTSSLDLDDTKLFFVNNNGVKSAYLIGMPEGLTAQDVVILDSATKQIKTIPKTALTGYVGTATLASGTVTVNTANIHTGYNIYVSYEAFNGTVGSLEAPKASIIDGTSFVINSSTGALDNSTVNWWIAP